MEEKPPVKAPRRKKRTSSVELEEKSIAASPDGGEMNASSSVTSHSTSAGTAVVTPKKASKRKKIPSSDSFEEENSMSVGGEATLSQERKTSTKIRQADLVTALEPKENSAVSNSKGSLLQEGKLSSKRKQSENPKDIAVTILELEEGTMAVSSETTIQEEKGSNRRKRSAKSKESADDKKHPIAVSLELETVPLQVDAVLSGRKRSAKAKKNAITILETDSASVSNSSVSFGAISTKVEPLASSEVGTHALVEDERSLPKRRRQRMKAKEDATASTDSSALPEDKTPVKVQRTKSKSKEPLASPERDRTTAEMISSSSKKVAASKPGLEITSKIDKISTQEAHAECTLEHPSLHEVRSVENSIDKASLTDGMPTISVVDSHASSRRRQSEALQLPGGSNINSPLSTEIVSTPANKGLTNLASILKDFASSISSESRAKKEKTAILKKASARQNLEGEKNASSIAGRLNKSIEVHTGQKYRMPKVEVNTFQLLGRVNKIKDTSVSQKWATPNTEENTPSTTRKVNQITGIFNQVKDGNQKWAAFKMAPFKRENFPIRSGGANNVTDTVAGHKQIMPRRNETAPIRTGRANQPKEFPAGGQKWAVPNRKENASRTAGMANQIKEKHGNQQWAPWKKNSPLANHARESTSVRFQEAISSMCIGTSPRTERESNEGQYLANMDRASGMERKGRRQFSVRNIVANQASTSSFMQIYGTGFDTGDTVPTVFLFFDRRRFIFNVGEGLHRFCMEHRFKLSKIDHVFLTRVCSETTGGLPGLILTLAEVGETGLTAQTWGPSNLQDLAKAMRTFIPSGWMDHTHCFGPKEDTRVLAVSDLSPPILLLEDELIKISAVLLHPANWKDSERAFQNTSESVMSGERKCDVSTVYICELSKVRGKFDPEKALAKGLKIGYKYGKLQRGESVMSDDGTTTVYPEDVLGPSNPGPIMFLVDCPSLSYIPSLTSSTSLQSYFPRTGKVVNCMVHISPTSVTSSKEYQCWMENFKETHHIMARRQTKVLGRPTLKSSAMILSKLNLICPRLFPIVGPQSQISIDVMNQKEAGGECMLVAENLLKFHFRPLANLGPDTSDIPEAFDPVAAHQKWSRESPEVLKAREKVEEVFKNWSQVNTLMNSCENAGLAGSRDFQDLPACLQDVSREEMELVFLGTGSSQPSKYRNVTGIYVHLFKHGGILLDCGEGTYAQLKRRYGAKGADDVLMGLKCIWISHMHADHFSGLSRILSARRQLLEIQSVCEPILVIGPKKLKVFLDAYGEIEDLFMEFLDCSQTTFEVQSFASTIKEEYAGVGGSGLTHRKGGLIRVPSEGGYVKSQMQYFWKQPGFHVRQGVDTAGRESLRRVLQSLGLKDLFSVPVVHCPHAFAVVLEAQGRQYNGSKAEPGWKLVFSGDTRPCQALIEAARGATILIHEATFDDGMLAEAVKKNHSMTKEAIEVGVSAEVYRIFLTHFSQRYPKVPVFDSSYNDRTCIAFDMMSVNLADLPLVPQLLPAFQLLFRDQSEADDDLVISA